MATMISPGQYRLSLNNETLTAATSWHSLLGTNANQILRLMGLYYGTSGTIDLGGGSDTLIVNTNAKARLDLKNVEFVYAGEGKSVSLQLTNTSGSTFTTDGSIREIIGGGGKEHVKFEHGLASAGSRPNGLSSVTLGLGGHLDDMVTFEQATRSVELPSGQSFIQNAWVIYPTTTGYAAYNNFRDYTVNILSNVENIFYNGSVITPGSSTLAISNVSFQSNDTTFIVEVPNANVYFRTGGANAFLNDSSAFVTNNSSGITQRAVIAERVVAAEGVLRVEVGSTFVESSEYLFIGSSGADSLSASTTNSTAIYGFGGNDILIGNSGVDSLFGGIGSDTITSGSSVDTIVFSHDGSLVTDMDTITDYQFDILDFEGDAVLLDAGGAAVAGVSVSTSANGKVTFAAGDDTLAEKIAALRADSRLDAINAVAIFSDGSDAYVYSAGSALGNTDDQIVKLLGVSTLDKLVVNQSGDVTVRREATGNGLTSITSFLPNQSSWSSPDGEVPSIGFTPGNDANSNTAQGDGVDGNTNQLIRNASGNFGTHVPGGDDTYGAVAIPTTLWSTGLNMFGTIYNTLYIGTNGYVTFGTGDSSFVPQGLTSYRKAPMIAGQFDDLYTDEGAYNIVDGAGAGTSQNSHNMYYYSDANKIVFTWDNVGLFGPSSSSNVDGKGSAFQIIIHKPTGESVTAQNFGMEIRYEEVTQEFSNATAGWTAGDGVNYGLINPDNVVLSTVANASSNVGINGVWAWGVNSGIVTTGYFVPDMGISTPVNVAGLSFLEAFPSGFTISGDGDGYGFMMGAIETNGNSSTAKLQTISNPAWNLWKEQYKDGQANIVVTPTGDTHALAKSIDIDIFSNGLDTVTRVNGASGTTLQVSGTSVALNTASNVDISSITTINATTSSYINLSNQTEALIINGSSGIDTLVGGSGNDTINGAASSDQINLGGGSDTLIMQSVIVGGIDVVTGFGIDDRLQFTSVTGYSFDNRNLDTYATMSDVLNQVTILRGASKATGFVYKGANYVVINAGTDAYDVNTDAVVQLIGTNLAALTETNFNTVV